MQNETLKQATAVDQPMPSTMPETTTLNDSYSSRSVGRSCSNKLKFQRFRCQPSCAPLLSLLLENNRNEYLSMIAQAGETYAIKFFTCHARAALGAIALLWVHPLLGISPLWASPFDYEDSLL